MGAKKLVVCCDGTWNDPEDRTHIFRIYEAARRLRRSDPSLEVYYDKGVGTRLGQIILGGAIGRGLSKNVREAYRWLLARYREGAQIFLFGFSRGAFTVRSLAGLIDHVGLLQPWEEARVADAWKAYRTKRRLAGNPPRPSIRFLGVFDTVGALGIPISALQKVQRLLSKQWDVTFHNTQLGKKVEIARQALAIDERRGSFKPTLWTRKPGSDGTVHVQQVWFAGVHADIGGGYEDKRLAEVPLVWMLEEARKAGLDLLPGFEVDPLYPHCGGCAHESRKGLYRALPSYQRPIGHSARKPRGLTGRLRHWTTGNSRLEVVGEWVHCSARERREGKVASELLGKDRPYDPRNFRLADEVDVLGECPPSVTPAPLVPPETPCPRCALYEGAIRRARPGLGKPAGLNPVPLKSSGQRRAWPRYLILAAAAVGLAAAIRPR